MVLSKSCLRNNFSKNFENLLENQMPKSKTSIELKIFRPYRVIHCFNSFITVSTKIPLHYFSMPKSLNVATFFKIFAAAFIIGKARTAPEPSPSLICKFNNGFNCK